MADSEENETSQNSDSSNQEKEESTEDLNSKNQDSESAKEEATEDLNSKNQDSESEDNNLKTADQDKQRKEKKPKLEEFSGTTSNESEDNAPIETANAMSARDLEAVYSIPVRVSAVLGKAKIQISQLLKLEAGIIVELDRKVGEAIDIYVNDRLVARGEVVIVDEKLGVTMTEIVKSEQQQ